MKKIQEIRAYAAAREAGYTDINIEINHPTPYTILNGQRYTLLFPKSMLGYQQEKTTEMLFMGLITDKRGKFLKRFESVATIVDSKRGRNMETKEKDEIYFNEMAKAQFVLCPNGSFVWTYRFFEAAIFRAIPIIEEYCAAYEGYKFFLRDTSDYVYREDWVEHNLAKVKKEMML